MTFDEPPIPPGPEREAMDFLKRGAKLRGLSPVQFQRIANRLRRQETHVKRRPWVPAVAVLGLVLLAGTTMAAVHGGFARLPIIGALISSPKAKIAVPTLHPRKHASLSTPAPTAPPAPPEATQPMAPEPVPALEIGHRRGLGAGDGAATAHLASEGRRAAIPLVRGGRRELAVRDSEAYKPSRHEEPVEATSALLEPPAALPAPSTLSESSSEHPPSSRAATDPVLDESRSFSAALAEWHRDHNAKAALAALDLHERRFPAGRIELEAKLLRAEILLQQGREREGLALLDCVSLTGIPRARELQTVRGELRVKLGRCAEGKRDLDHVLAKDATDALGKRAARAMLLCP